MPQFFNDAVETHPLLTPERQTVIDVDEVKGGRMKKKCKKIKRFWKALFGHSKASQKYTQMTSSADDEDTDAAALQSRRNTESMLHDMLWEYNNAFICLSTGVYSIQYTGVYTYLVFEH